MNTDRLIRCMERAGRGEELTIGFFGGSITQGCAAKSEEHTFAFRVFRWWQMTFPDAEFHYVNAGIGGTTSHYGAARAVPDLLMYQPDFVVVDFSVNDEPEEFFRETYEGMIRRILSWQSEPAVVLLGNVFYDSGKTAQEQHVLVGDRYRLPYVSIRDTVYRRMREGAYTMEVLTSDGLHPNDRGHALVAKEIIRYLETVRAETERDRPVCGSLPEPLTENAYESAKRLTIRECAPLLMGFRADTREKTGLLDGFKNGWIGKRPGDRIQFHVTASCIAVQYRKSVKHPALSAELVLDGDEAHPILLEGDFKENWGDCQYLQPVLHHGAYGMHRIDIRILPCREKKAEAFYLMALITA